MESKEENKNPFVQKGKSIVSFTAAPKTINVVSGDNKIFLLQEASTTVTYVKDKLEFVKIYKNGLSAVKKLSSSGLNLLCYILEILPPKTDTIILYVPEIQDYCGYKSKKAVYKGINDLITNEFISKVPDTTDNYYININYFYNGKRN